MTRLNGCMIRCTIHRVVPGFASLPARPPLLTANNSHSPSFVQREECMKFNALPQHYIGELLLLLLAGVT